jgi:hypothetical protein
MASDMEFEDSNSLLVNGYLLLGKRKQFRCLGN